MHGGFTEASLAYSASSAATLRPARASRRSHRSAFFSRFSYWVSMNCEYNEATLICLRDTTSCSTTRTTEPYSFDTHARPPRWPSKSSSPHGRRSRGGAGGVVTMSTTEGSARPRRWPLEASANLPHNGWVQGAPMLPRCPAMIVILASCHAEINRPLNPKTAKPQSSDGSFLPGGGSCPTSRHVSHRVTPLP